MFDQNEPNTKIALLARINQAANDLDKLLRPLSEAQIERPGPEQWAIKDHLYHLAVWEAYITGLLTGTRPPEAEPIWTGFEGDLDETAENALIYERGAPRSAAEVRRMLSGVHTRTLAVLEGITDADLLRPFADFVSGSDDQRPILGWIAGNTYGHYDEHLEYIKRQFGMD